MKLYILNGSSRNNGYSSIAAELMISELEKRYEVVYDRAIQKKVAFCTGCDVCKSNEGKCVFSDDMDEILSHLKDSDRILILSGIYFSALPAQLKVIIDRCQVFFNNSEKKYKQKDAFFVFFGGAKSYPEQFLSADAEFKHVLIHINASLRKTLNFSHTDEFNGILSIEVKEKILALADAI